MHGYEGSLRDFLIKAHKALSGGSSKTQIKQVPPSLMKPPQPWAGASPGPNTPSYPHHAASYAQILPRPSSGALATSSPYQGQAYQNQGYPVPMVPGGQSYEIRQGSATQPSQAPVPARPAFAKQSHSPIPLPPYVKQMPTSSPSSPRPCPLGVHTEQVALPVTPQTASASTTDLTPAQANGNATAAPALSSEAHMGPPPNGQWTPPSGNEPGSTAAAPWAPPAPGPTPGPTTQSSPGFQTSSQPPQAQPLQGSAATSPTVDSQDNKIYVERVMMNLRRASMQFGGFGTGQG
jgi:hypothetical protein